MQKMSENQGCGPSSWTNSSFMVRISTGKN